MAEKIFEGALADLMACCEPMRQQLMAECPDHSSPDCPDVLITHDSRGYVLLIHDGGTSGLTIAFCPFCGAKLPTPEHPPGTRCIEV